jgi:hypothetical protein
LAQHRAVPGRGEAGARPDPVPTDEAPPGGHEVAIDRALARRPPYPARPGQARARQVFTSAGAVPAAAPRINDKRTDERVSGSGSPR